MNILETFLPFFSKYKFPVLIGVIGLICFGYGLISLFAPKSSNNDITFTPAIENEKSVKAAQDIKDPSSSSGRQIVIDVSGAVLRPGVYHLPIDSRLQDALTAAGGMSNEADQEVIAKQLNLAAKLTDGAKVYIPKAGEQPIANSEVANGNSGASGSGLVNINSATESQLDELSGIGPVTAQKIIDNRPYGSIDELVQKKIVGNSVFEKIKDSISVY